MIFPTAPSSSWGIRNSTCHVVLLPFFSFLSKGKSGILKPSPKPPVHSSNSLWALKMLQGQKYAASLNWIVLWQGESLRLKNNETNGGGVECVLTWPAQNPSGLLVRFAWILRWEGQLSLPCGLFLERPDLFIYNKLRPWPLDQGGRPRSCGWASPKVAGPSPPKVFQEC